MIKVITSVDELAKCNVLWEKLNDYCNIFTFNQWFLSWWKCYGDKKSLRVYVLIDDNTKDVVILPLMLSNEGEVIILSQLCDSCSDYFKVICNTNSLTGVKELMGAVVKNEVYDRFTISNLRIDDENTEILIRAAFWANTKIDVTIQEENYFIKTGGEYKNYFLKQSKNFRHKINNIRKRGQNFKFEIISEYDNEILSVITRLHCRKWNNDMQVSVFFDQRRIDFLKSICIEYAKKGWLRIFVLKDNDNIVAYRLGFVYENIYYDWNTSYDITYKEMSVGILLCDYVVRYCFSENIKEFDFLRGEEDYKKKFATDSRELLKLDICKATDRNDRPLPPKVKLSKLMQDVKGFIFDLDGVVYSGKKPIISTIEFINYLLENNIKVGFLTNTSSKYSNSIRFKLESMGIESNNYYLETSATATSEYLRENNIKECVVYGGDEVLADEIRKNNIKVIDIYECNQDIDAVVVGYSTKFEYDVLTIISELIRKGAQLIATDADKMFSHNNKCLPGTAWILSSIEEVNRKKAYIIGKPNNYSALYLLKKMKIFPSNIMVIGDNIESDILMAKGIGAVSCLLLGGVSNEIDVAKLKLQDRPDIIVDDLSKLKKYVKETRYEEKN